MQKLRHFTARDFRMDGVDVSDKMNPAFLEKLDQCRENAGVAFVVTSSFRTKAKNKAVGGATNSYHLKGRAVDVLTLTDAIRARVVKAALDMGLRVGVMENAVHIDDGEKQVCFHYYKSKKRG
jgi:uncharacterized protein YcbK (DUF882 family)